MVHFSKTYIFLDISSNAKVVIEIDLGSDRSSLNGVTPIWPRGRGQRFSTVTQIKNQPLIVIRQHWSHYT